MRLKSIAIYGVLVVVGLAGGFASALYLIPFKATDLLFARFLQRGSVVNQMSQPIVRNAKTNSVPQDNADTLTRSAIIDLSKGPLVFQADVPANAVYWSISLFAHNTDTFFVANDQKVGPGPYSLLIKTRAQATPTTSVDDIAISPTRKAFLIIRYTMPDRNNPTIVAAMREQILKESIGPAT